MSSTVAAIHPYHRAALDNARSAILSSTGGRNREGFKQAAALGNLVAGDGLDETLAYETVMRALLDRGLLEDEARAAVRRGLEAGKKSPRQRSVRAATGSIAASEDTTFDNTHVKRDAKGRIVVSVENLANFLRYHDDWRILPDDASDALASTVLGYNERSNQVVFTAPPPWGPRDAPVPRELRDTDVARISQWFGENYDLALAPTNAHLAGAISVIAETNAFDPVRDYLDKLAWDGVPRLDTMLATYVGAIPSSINAAFGAKFMISAVARVYKPGVKVDHVLVLQGPQGAGKSSVPRVLAGEESFGDCLPDLRNKDASDYLLGLWIVEMAELDTLNRSELNTAKAFITRQEDRYRAAYARRKESHPRRCVFLATTNEDEYLRDSTGNRRFWPVSVGRIDLAALRHDRDQLWAEAVHRFKAGESWHLDDPTLIREAQAAQEERYQEEPWTARIREYVDGKAYVMTHEIMEHALELNPRDLTKANEMKVASVLKKLGWAKRYVGAVKGRAWIATPAAVTQRRKWRRRARPSIPPGE